MIAFAAICQSAPLAALASGSYARPPAMAAARFASQIDVYSGKTGIEPWTWAWSAKDPVTGVLGHVRLNVPKDTDTENKAENW